MEESRKYLRVPCRLRCWCEADDVTVYARVVNLSEGGLFLRTNTPLKPGARTQVRLSGTDPLEIRAPATVVWARSDESRGPPGMGLAFDRLEPSALEYLRGIIRTEVAANHIVPMEP